MLVNTLFYEAVDALLDVVDRLSALMRDTSIPYELIGGMAVFIHMQQVSEENARLTNDVDVSIRRSDLDRLKDAASRFGFQYRHSAGIDMLVDANSRTAKGAIHFVFSGEKVRPDYLAAVPEITSPPLIRGVRIAPIEHIVLMKLTSFRLKDMMHLRDMLNVGLITPDIADTLPPALRERLDFVKAHE